MKESKGVNVTKHAIKRDSRRAYAYENCIKVKHMVANCEVRRYDGTREEGCQVDLRRELMCTCRVATIKHHNESRYFNTLPEQIYAYHGVRSFTTVGVGNVKTIQRRKVKKIYLPDTDDRGVGSSEVSAFLIRKPAHYGDTNYGLKRTSSKCVGGVLRTTDTVVNEKLSPIVQCHSATTGSEMLGVTQDKDENIEFGGNTENKKFATVTTQIDIEANGPDDVIHKDKNKKYKKSKDGSQAMTPRSKVYMARRAREEEKFSSDSLVQHVHDLEYPSVDKPSRTSVDLMENKVEKEYRQMFEFKNQKHDKPVDDCKSTSLLRRRFEALRRGLKKDEPRKNVVEVSSSSPTSVLSRKDVSVASDPPSLEARSYYNTKPDPPEYNRASYRRSVTGKRDSVQSMEDEGNELHENVSGMFKLWGKKFNLDEDTEARAKVSNDASKLKEESEKMRQIDSTVQKKPGGKKFSFFKRKSKDQTKPEKPSYKNKKGLTANRCEVKTGLLLKVGKNSNAYSTPVPSIKPKVVTTKYEEIVRKAWLKKFLSNSIESSDSVKIRWYNNTYSTSSSTVFELMDNVYKQTGIVIKSKSDITTNQKSYRPDAKRVNFIHRNIEAWMIPKTLTNRPVVVPINNYNAPEKCGTNNIQVRIPDQKWSIDKAKTFSHKIELVIHSNDNNISSDFLRIDIPSGFFSDSCDEGLQCQTSDEEVYKIVEYEALKSDSEVQKKTNKDTGDHASADIRLTVSVKDSKDIESKILETVIKRPPTHRDVVIQGSNVFFPKRCDVIGVGILTQRDVRDMKPILNINDDLSDESESTFFNSQKNCEFAQSYLQDYYRQWMPLGMDPSSWCVSDSRVKCCSEKNSDITLNQGDGSKSCPNICEEHRSPALGSSFEGPSCRHFYNHFEDEINNRNKIFFGKFSKKETVKPNPDQDKRVLPKDSLEVFKKRKIYALSNKAQWASSCSPVDGPLSVPSLVDKGEPETLTDYNIKKKPCCKQSPPKKKKSSTKHVSLPNCETLCDNLKEKAIEGILAFTKPGGVTACETCKKSGEKCPKHPKINPIPCEIKKLDPPCKKECEKIKKPACEQKTSRGSPSLPCTPPSPRSRSICPPPCFSSPPSRESCKQIGPVKPCPPAPPPSLKPPAAAKCCHSGSQSPTLSHESRGTIKLEMQITPLNSAKCTPKKKKLENLKCTDTPPSPPKKCKGFTPGSITPPCSGNKSPRPTDKVKKQSFTPSSSEDSDSLMEYISLKKFCIKPPSRISKPAVEPNCNKKQTIDKDVGDVCYMPSKLSRPSALKSPCPANMNPSCPPQSNHSCPSGPNCPNSTQSNSSLSRPSKPRGPPQSNHSCPSGPNCPNSTQSNSSLSRPSKPRGPPKSNHSCPSGPNCPNSTQSNSSFSRPSKPRGPPQSNNSCPFGPNCPNSTQSNSSLSRPSKPRGPPKSNHSCPSGPNCPNSAQSNSSFSRPSKPRGPPQSHHSCPSGPNCPNSTQSNSSLSPPLKPRCPHHSKTCHSPPLHPLCNPQSKTSARSETCPPTSNQSFPPLPDCPSSTESNISCPPPSHPPRHSPPSHSPCPPVKPRTSALKSSCPSNLNPPCSSGSNSSLSAHSKPCPSPLSYPPCPPKSNPCCPHHPKPPCLKPSFSTPPRPNGTSHQNPPKPVPLSNPPCCCASHSNPSISTPSIIRQTFHKNPPAAPQPPCPPPLSGFSCNCSFQSNPSYTSSRNPPSPPHLNASFPPPSDPCLSSSSSAASSTTSLESQSKPCVTATMQSQHTEHPLCPMSPQPECPKYGEVNKIKISGLHLRKNPSKKKSGADCAAIDGNQKAAGNDELIELNRDYLNIRVKKCSASTDEIREIKIRDEDGDTLCERKEYKQPKKTIHRPAALGEMYKTSNECHRVSTKSAQILESDEKPIRGVSSQSLDNLVEIQFSMKVTQGDKVTEINIGNDGDSEKEKITQVPKKCPRETYVVHNQTNPPENVSNSDKNKDINIHIVIKNFKRKERIKSHGIQEDFTNKISKKFHTVSTGYSEISQSDLDQNEEPSRAFSIHRATWDLTGSDDKCKAESKQSEELSDFTDKELKNPKSLQSATNFTQSVVQSNTAIEERSSWSEKVCDNKSDDDEDINAVIDDTDHDTALELVNHSNEDTSSDPLKPNTSPKEEKKQMLKMVIEKAGKIKHRNKDKVSRLTKMLKDILTSDSSGHVDMAVTSNDLVNDITYTSLEPNFFRDTDSMNNYYKMSSITSKIKDMKNVKLHPTQDQSDNSVYFKDSIKCCTGSACLCSTVATKLNILGQSGCCCRGPVKNYANIETNCDIRADEDTVLNNYGSATFIDQETQRSRQFCSKANSAAIDYTSKNHITAISNIINVKESKPGKEYQNKELQNIFSAPARQIEKDLSKMAKKKENVLNIPDEDIIIIANMEPKRNKVNLERDPHEKTDNFKISADMLQSYETKKAVLEIYTERAVSGGRKHLVAKLPKFVQENESEIIKYEKICTRSFCHLSFER